jgi:cell shape-determining protein MreC
MPYSHQPKIDFWGLNTELSQEIRALRRELAEKQRRLEMLQKLQDMIASTFLKGER